jgi:hypothetical protein
MRTCVIACFKRIVAGAREKDGLFAGLLYHTGISGKLREHVKTGLTRQPRFYMLSIFHQVEEVLPHYLPICAMVVACTNCHTGCFDIATLEELHASLQRA